MYLVSLVAGCQNLCVSLYCAICLLLHVDLYACCVFVCLGACVYMSSCECAYAYMSTTIPASILSAIVCVCVTSQRHNILKRSFVLQVFHSTKENISIFTSPKYISCQIRCLFSGNCIVVGG